jgi:cell division protein FtsZ
MMDRRQFIQACLSAAAVSLPFSSRALPLTEPTRCMAESCTEALAATTGEVSVIDPKIKVIGVGGGGGNAARHMIDSGVHGVEFVFANTDMDALRACGSHKTIQLHRKTPSAKTKLGRCRETAELAASELRSAIGGADLLFITVGMGGGTGTQAAPVIARIAREMGILTVAVVTMPFSWEGGRRSSAANVGLAKLRAWVDTLIVLPNDKLIETLGDDITQDEAFHYVNDVVKNAVSGIADIINVPSAVNVDFGDVRNIMCEPGTAFIGSATASGSERARLAAEQALTSPMQGSKDVSQAKGVLVMIASAQRVLKLSEARLAANTVRKYTSIDAHLIYGTTFDEALKDEIRVTVLATGLNAVGESRTLV